MKDLIDRQDAIDAVEFDIIYAKAINKSTGEVKELFKEGNKALNEAVERLKELPSAQPEQRWIPCSERLPEKWGDYLVTMKWKGVGSGEVYMETNMATYNYRAKKWDCTDVIAWMPLPEPYKPESDSKSNKKPSTYDIERFFMDV